MNQNRKLLLLGFLIAGASCVPLAAQANGMTTVSMELTGVDGAPMDGVYTSPYDALIGPAGLKYAWQFTSSNSTSTDIFCDDFLTDVSVGHIWQATVTNMGSLSGISSPLTSLKFDTMDTVSQQQHDYMAAAYLAEEIVGLDPKSIEAGELSYAIWGIFDPGMGGTPTNPTSDGALLSKLSGSELTAAESDIQGAYAAVKNDDPTVFSNVNIYTPDPKDASQEYLTVSPVPEPGSLALFGAGILGLGLVFRSRRAPKAVAG